MNSAWVKGQACVCWGRECWELWKTKVRKVTISVELVDKEGRALRAEETP